jgi:hypothetical protein
MCTEDYSEFEEIDAETYEKEEAEKPKPFSTIRKSENLGEKR